MNFYTILFYPKLPNIFKNKIYSILVIIIIIYLNINIIIFFSLTITTRRDVSTQKQSKNDVFIIDSRQSVGCRHLIFGWP